MIEEKDYIKTLVIIQGISRKHMPDLPYHNYDHADEVALASGRMGCYYLLSGNDALLLGTASYLHDIIFEVGGKDNEERSAQFAYEHLPSLGYEQMEIEQIGKLILATKLPTNPESRLEEIICDADLSNLGTPRFFSCNDALQRERDVKDRLIWLEGSYDFLKGHGYYTEAGRNLFGEGIQRNLSTLKNLINIEKQKQKMYD